MIIVCYKNYNLNTELFGYHRVVYLYLGYNFYCIINTSNEYWTQSNIRNGHLAVWEVIIEL